MSKMTETELLQHIDAIERQAVGYYTGEVASEQSRAMDYYLGKPFGTEEEGRSQVISSDVWDVVEGMAPLVLRPFVSSDEIVRFAPIGPEDEKPAEQESEYLNWVITQRNESFTQLVAWCKTGLLQKNGVVKWWWEVNRRPRIERYEGLSDDLYTLLVSESGGDVVEHTAVTSVGVDGVETVSHDCVLRVVEEVGVAKFQAIPPEEFRVSRDACSPNPQEASFVQHVRRISVGELRALGYDVPDDIDGGEADDPTMAVQYTSRRNADESGIGGAEGTDPLSREVTFKETYLLVDYDGDGQQELRKVCAVGSRVLANDETEEIPFASWTPYPQPFKFYGRCPADETIEIQLAKSTLLRQTFDNVYTINNNRTWANERVNLDDLVDNQIAGVVRVKGNEPVGNAIGTAPIQPIGGVTLPLIELMDSNKENRTGFTRYNQGSDGQSLNKTATGVRIIAEAGNQRIEIIQRAFADGLACLMRGMHGLIRRHATKQETVRLRGEWVTVDPRAWKTRTDMTIAVGLGTADQQMKLTGIQMLLNEQKQLAAAGIVQPQNMLHSAHKLAEVVGYKNPEMFFSMPEQPQVPPEIQQQMAQAQQVIDELGKRLQEAEGGIVKARVDAEAKIAIERAKGENAMALEQMRGDLKRDMDELAAYVKLLIAGVQQQQIQAEVSEDLAEENDEQAGIGDYQG